MYLIKKLKLDKYNDQTFDSFIDFSFYILTNLLFDLLSHIMWPVNMTSTSPLWNNLFKHFFKIPQFCLYDFQS